MRCPQRMKTIFIIPDLYPKTKSRSLGSWQSKKVVYFSAVFGSPVVDSLRNRWLLLALELSSSSADGQVLNHSNSQIRDLLSCWPSHLILSVKPFVDDWEYIDSCPQRSQWCFMHQLELRCGRDHGFGPCRTRTSIGVLCRDSYCSISDLYAIFACPKRDYD